MLSLLFGIALMAQDKAMIKSASPQSGAGSEAASRGWTLVIHGGAGGPEKGTMSEDVEKQYVEKLTEALKLGSEVLAGGGSSLDAVEKVVTFLEDCPLFNAGKGAVLNENGIAELDASIMDGRTGMAGAVAAVKTIMNPVSAARLVMDKTNHVMLVGKGAEDFAKAAGMKMAEPSYFITPERMSAWKKWKERSKPVEDKKDPGQESHGTVGAVALDGQGNLAAATSTGGLMGKMAGRVGDSPVIGAGTYADNNTCAVSGTGQGEYFIRNVIAYDLSALMACREIPLEEAARSLVMEKLVKQEASGGLIAVDREGNIAMPFNTKAMYRGYARSTGEFQVDIY